MDAEHDADEKAGVAGVRFDYDRSRDWVCVGSDCGGANSRPLDYRSGRRRR
jgi:hypothetical protein